MTGSPGDVDEEPLFGDGVTPGIVRIGRTVRRPVRPFTATVHAYLAHLHRVGFARAPVPLGIDEQGREILSYVPGDVPREPLPDQATTETVLTALARLIRELHDASQGWQPPADAVWGGNPRLSERPGLVSHRDYCPGNVVFREGVPAALIDFDLAAPTLVRRYHEFARSAAQTSPVFRRLWDEGVRDRMPRAEAWIDNAAPQIAARLASRA